MLDPCGKQRRKSLRSASYAFALCAALAGAAHAGERWVPLGPSGGVVRLLAQGTSDPSRLYVATERTDLFASRDGGRSWHSIRGGFSGGDIQRLAVAPGDPDALLVATSGDVPFYQVWHSEDGGARWAHATEPPAAEGQSLLVLDLAIDPVDARTAYAATERGIYRSVDGGDTWASWALPQLSTTSIAHAPGARGSLFVAGYPASDFRAVLYRSDDGGVTWSETPPFAFPLPDRLFFHVGTLYAQSGPSLYRSSDEAETWSLAARLPTLEARDFAIAPSGRIYAATLTGVYSSTDGTNWSPPEVLQPGRGTPNDFVAHLAVIPGGPLGGSETVIAGGSRGLWRSTDRGGKWQPASRGIAVHDVQSLIVVPDSQGTVLATVDDRLYRIDRDGRSWRVLAPPPELEFPDLAADPHHPGRIYALGGFGAVGVSEDRGNSWRKLSELLNTGVVLLKVDPVHPDVLYAGIRTGGGSSTEYLVYRSVDGGVHWTKILDDGLLDVTFDPRRPNVGYRLTFSGIDKSTDGGAHWTRLPNLVGQLLGSGAASILIDSRSGDLYAGTDDRGVFRSTDSGRTFRRVAAGLPQLPGGRNPPVAKLVQDAGGEISAALPYVGVYRLNPGRGWSALGTGLPIETFVRMLVADPVVPGLLYAGSIGSSVHRLERE